MTKRMQAKIEHLRKLLTYRNQHTFDMPSGPGSVDLERKIVAKMHLPEKAFTWDRDVTVSFSTKKPEVIAIYTCVIGDPYDPSTDSDKYDEEIPLFEEFLDFAIAYERNNVHKYICNELMEDARKNAPARADARMKELGL